MFNTLFSDIAFNDSYIEGENATLFGGLQSAANQAIEIPVVGDQAPDQMVDNYGGASPVSYETWQNQLAFDDLTGNGRSDAAKNEYKWYQNYVNTWNAADEATRNAIDVQHGFAIAQEAPAPQPVSVQHAAGEATAFAEVTAIQEAAQADRHEITAVPGDHNGDGVKDEGVVGGLEDTTVVNQVYDEETEKVAAINNLAPVTPLDAVVDPATGQQYDSPAAARKAGITNWVYLTDWNT